MRSVIIMNNKTTDLFCQFRPLFLNALCSQKISVCKWLEAGTTIQTAVPELYEAIGDAEKWRAIIVLADSDDEMSGFPAAENNPFDFPSAYAGGTGAYGENQVPLTRLSQMLGGVPRPEVRFEKKLVKVIGKPPQTVYEPCRDEDEEKMYEALCERYELNVTMPEEVLFIGIRKNFDPEVNRRRNLRRNDAAAPDRGFFERNRYPVTCRFLAFDMNKKGTAGYIDDLFRFWTSVLLLAENKLNAGTLHAYELYSMDTVIDREKLRDVLQEAASNVVFCRSTVKKRLADEYDLTEDNSSVVGPDYSVSVDVPVSDNRCKKPLVNEKMFGMTTESHSEDIRLWGDTTSKVSKEMHIVEKNNERILDQTAMGLHKKCIYDDSFVRVLNEYQLEDLYEHLDADRSEVAELAAKLPSDESNAVKQMKKTEVEVRNELLMRVSGKQVMIGIIINSMALAVCMIPAMLIGSRISLVAALSIFLASICIVGITTFAVLLSQKGRLSGILGKYNQYVKLRFSELLDDNGIYAHYLSAIASHMRGSSYLNILRKRRSRLYAERDQLHEQLRNLDSFESLLRVWAKAFYVSVNFNRRNDFETDFNMEIPAICNPVYSVASHFNTEIKLNGSEETLQTPVSFVEKLIIKQEELYYDSGK